MDATFTLNKNSLSIKHLCDRDKHLASLIDTIGPITYTIPEDPYTFLIHEIIEQMLSAKAGNKIFSRLLDICEGLITPEKINLLTTEEIRSIGTSNSKVSCIKNLTSVVINKELVLSELSCLTDDEVFAKLTSIKDIGKWTANMYLMFVLNREDILPTNDAAFIQAYKWLYNIGDTSEKSIKENCVDWKPYSSIASRYLYYALNTGLTKNINI